MADQFVVSPAFHPRKFDLDQAVDLLRNQREENYPWEREVALYAFLSWLALNRKGTILQRAVRRVAGAILHTKCINNEFKQASIKSSDALIKWLRDPRVIEFNQHVLPIIGGISKIRVGSPVFTAQSWSAEQKKRATEEDLIRFTIRMIRIDANFATRQSAIQALARDIFNKHAATETTIEKGKRASNIQKTNERELQKGTRKEPIIGNQPSAVAARWDRLESTSLLKVCIGECMPNGLEMLTRPAASIKFMKELQGLSGDKKNLCHAFLMYDTVLNRLQSLSRPPNVTRKWKVIRTTDQLQLGVLPCFSNTELEKLKRIFPDKAEKFEARCEPGAN